MAKFKFAETTHNEKILTARLGSDTIANAGSYTDKEVGKAVKLVAESRYALCAAGDPIEGKIIAAMAGSFDGYSLGSVQTNGMIHAVCDGLEATPGTGTIAIGDYVVVGTVVAAGTALSGDFKVTKATNQPGVAIVSTVASADTAAAVKTALDAVLVKVADAEKNGLHAWRVVSLGNAGAVGDTCVIQRVGKE